MNQSLNLIYVVWVLGFVGCTDKKRETSEADSVRFSGKKFNEHIRSTEARTPEEERLGFKLPPGFE
ncbi:MAG TPA: hypothetical protein VFD46_15125, partial [Chryseolinea sp.]|nr:hypothetical protein [Chryseolinea sp.]